MVYANVIETNGRDHAAGLCHIRWREARCQSSMTMTSSSGTGTIAPRVVRRRKGLELDPAVSSSVPRLRFVLRDALLVSSSESSITIGSPRSILEGLVIERMLRGVVEVAASARALAFEEEFGSGCWTGIGAGGGEGGRAYCCVQYRAVLSCCALFFKYSFAMEGTVREG